MALTPDRSIGLKWTDVEAAALAHKNGVYYAKPPNGIPASHLAEDVQESLEKADNAIPGSAQAEKTAAMTKPVGMDQQKRLWVTPDVLRVSITYSGGAYACDASLADILAAHTAGKIIEATTPDGIAYCTNAASDEANFVTSDSSGGTPLHILYTVGAGVSRVATPIGGSGGSGLTSNVKEAFLACFRGVEWIDAQSADLYDALEAALYPPANLVSISASFDPVGTIYDGATLDSLRQYLTVTALYDDQSTETVTAYTLAGTLTVGTNTVAVSYGGKTTRFVVTVAAAPLIPVEYQRVTYIASTNTGNGPYLIVPFTFPANYKIKAKTYISAKPSSGAAALIGAKYTAGNNTYTSRLEVGYLASDGKVYAWSAATTSVTVTGLYGNPAEIEATFRSTSPYKELKVSTPSDEATSSNTSTANNTDMTHLLVFAMSYSPFAGRIYSVVIEDMTGNALMELVPCYRKNDSVIGMYERVTGVFYTNAGSFGTFTKGADVED